MSHKEELKKFLLDFIATQDGEDVSQATIAKLRDVIEIKSQNSIHDVKSHYELDNE